MVTLKSLTTSILLLFSLTTLAQVDNFRFVKYLHEKPNEITAFAVSYEGKQTLETLRQNNISIKHITPNWVYVQTTAQKIDELTRSKQIKQFYFEFNVSKPMSDTARIVQHVKEVQEGYGALLQPYTGKNIVVGFVDTGLDWGHPDFIDENGVYRTMPIGIKAQQQTEQHHNRIITAEVAIHLLLRTERVP